MIVALVPGVAAFSGVHSKPVATAAAVGFPESLASGTVATYNQRSSWPKTRRSMTGLQYISGADNDHTTNKPATGNSWWTSVFGGEHTSAADDYLEFLDRRYNRILKDEEDSKGFSVMSWLYQNTNGETEASSQKPREEDALYVLGVANLASRKFLQKHHLLSPEEEVPNKASAKQKDAIVTDAEIVENTAAPVPAAAIVAVFHEVARRRELLLQRQSKGVRVALTCALHSIVTGPTRALHAVRRLYVVGGGTKSLAMTVSAVAALSIFLRPLIRVAAVEASNTMG